MAVWRTRTNSYLLQTLLIVADNPEKAAFWRQLFSEEGYNVVVGNTVQAVYAARSLNPHLVLADVDLPHVERLALYGTLKIASQAVLMAVIPLHPLEIVETYAAGVDECLIQPVNPPLILVKVMAWMLRQQLPSADHVAHKAFL